MSIGYASGLRALLAARRAMDVIGHNLANQNTPGYSRQIALLQTSPTAIGTRGIRFGTGVDLVNVTTNVNQALLQRIRTELGRGARHGVESDLYDQLEGLFADLTDQGVSARLQGFFDGATEAATAPEDLVLRQDFAQSADGLAVALRTRAKGVADFRTEALLEARTLVSTANDLLSRVASLNARILSEETGGLNSNDLRDQRNEAAERLAELTGASAAVLPNGTVNVTIAGFVVVNGAASTPLEAVLDGAGGIQVRTAKGKNALKPQGGRLGGLLHVIQTDLPARAAELDALARNLIRETNRLHATGVPRGGPFTSLGAAYAVNVTGVANPASQPLAHAGLPFEIEAGELSIAITDQATGDVERHVLKIDPHVQTVGHLVSALDGLPHVTAFLDGAGKLQLRADGGYAFDFSRRVDALPVEGGTFGDAAATAVAGATFPLALQNGAALTVAVDGGAPQAVTFSSTDFADIGNATAAEVAAVLNAQLTGATASVVDGKLVLRSDTEGAASALAIADGAFSPAAALGLPAAAAGTATPVTVTVAGTPAANEPHAYTFRAVGDGAVGITPGLAVEVLDESGKVVATLDVGAGYEPGAALTFADGLTVAFSPGDLAGSGNQFFELDAPGETDTSGVLAAFGLNAFFVGTDAKTLAVREELLADPAAISGGLGGGPGDGGNFLRLAALADTAVAGLGGGTLGGFYDLMAADLGAASAGAKAEFASAAFVVESLLTRRANESGVNPDEELLELERFQQVYDASARFLSVLNELNDTLLQL